MSVSAKRILIVEDQRVVAADLEDTLQRLGYEVVGSVASADEAIATAISVRPDLALMDIRLRGELDGIQAAAAIRERMDIPIAYLTAYADVETIRRAGVTGPFGYLVKPFNERELRAAIEIAIYKHGTDRLLAEERARRQAAEGLKEAAARTQAMMVGALDCIISTDAHGFITDWNPAAERTLGYTREEAIGQDIAQLIVPERLRKEFRDELAWVLRSGETPLIGKRVKLPALTKSRGEIVVEESVTMSLVGGRPMFSAFLRDITAQERAENERMHQAEARHLLDDATVALASSLNISETIQKAARCAIPALADWCLVDLASDAGELRQTAVAHVNPEKEELAQRLRREPVTDQQLERGAHHVFRTGKSEVHAELGDPSWAARLLGIASADLLKPLGAACYVCVPIPSRGKTLGVLNLIRATSGGWCTADDLWIAEELGRRIGLAIENARLFSDAQEAIRVRDEFLQVASHELKTPLTPLQLQLDTLIRGFQKSGIQNQRLCDKLDTAIRQTARLRRLVETLLDVSRITAGRFELEIETCDLSVLVRGVAEQFQAEAKRARSEFKVNTDRAVVGWWDPLRLEQIIANLLSNAIKYGSGKPIEIEARQSEGTVRVVVTDHGIGMDEQTLGRIFGRFERGVSLRHYGGLGLGLFIARQFAEAHGGNIVVKSQPGGGSTFTLILPTVAREQPDVATASAEVKG